MDGDALGRRIHPRSRPLTRFCLLARACVLTDVTTVNRLVARGENYLMDLVLDINSQVGTARTDTDTPTRDGNSQCRRECECECRCD